MFSEYSGVCTMQGISEGPIGGSWVSLSLSCFNVVARQFMCVNKRLPQSYYPIPLKFDHARRALVCCLICPRAIALGEVFWREWCKWRNQSDICVGTLGCDAAAASSSYCFLPVPSQRLVEAPVLKCNNVLNIYAEIVYTKLDTITWCRGGTVYLTINLSNYLAVDIPTVVLLMPVSKSS